MVRDLDDYGYFVDIVLWKFFGILDILLSIFFKEFKLIVWLFLDCWINIIKSVIFKFWYICLI